MCTLKTLKNHDIMNYRTKFNKTRELLDADITRIQNNPYEGSAQTLSTLRNILGFMNKIDKNGKKGHNKVQKDTAMLVSRETKSN
jgi:hypothetical protein